MSKITDSIFTCGSVQSKNISITKSTVTQLTGSTTGVTVQGNAGIITSVSLALATSGSSSFPVTNGSVLSTSLVMPSIVNYTGTGTPHVRVSGVTSGSFTMTLSNSHPTAPLNAVAQLGFLVI